MTEADEILQSYLRLVARLSGAASVSLYVPPAAGVGREILIHSGPLDPLPELADAAAAEEFHRRFGAEEGDDDDRGRLADRSPICAAGWAPGQPVTISIANDHRLVLVRPDGPQTITRHGHLRLPASVRHTCGLSAGDRLLVTVTATPPLLTVYPMATVEAILRRLAPASTATGTS